MFTWICPKCKKEVPPAYSECPHCAAAETPATTQQPKSDAPAARAAAAPEPVEPAPAPASEDDDFKARVRRIQAAAPPAPAQERSGRGWLIGLLVGATLVVVALTAVIFLRTRGAGPAAAADSPKPVLESPQSQSAAPANPVLKYLELTGFRLSEDTKKKTVQLQFVIVNHSSADLGTLKGNVNLHAAAAKFGDEPVGTFTFVTELGPFQSKELTVPVQTQLRAYELPDWQLLRANVSLQ